MPTAILRQTRGAVTRLHCRPGDRAFVRSCPNAPENIGRIVRVLRPALPGEFTSSTSDGTAPAWIVRSEGTPLVCTVAGLPLRFYGMERPMLDAMLQPLPPAEFVNLELPTPAPARPALAAQELCHG